MITQVFDALPADPVNPFLPFDSTPRFALAGLRLAVDPSQHVDVGQFEHAAVRRGLSKLKPGWLQYWSPDRPAKGAMAQLGAGTIDVAGSIALGRLPESRIQEALAEALSDTRGAGRTPPALGVPVKNMGGSGQQIGVIRVVRGTVEVAVAGRQAGGISHADLGKAAFGPIEAGERRIGFSIDGSTPIVHQSSTGYSPGAGDLEAIGLALRAAGFSGGQVILGPGSWVDVK